MKASELLPEKSASENRFSGSRMKREYEAAIYLRSAELLALFEEAGWVKPSLNKHKLKLYDLRVLDAACDRLLVEELPSSISSSNGDK